MKGEKMAEGIILTDKELVELNKEMDKKVSSDTVKNIVIIEKGASTKNIAPNTLIFEKE